VKIHSLKCLVCKEWKHICLTYGGWQCQHFQKILNAASLTTWWWRGFWKTKLKCSTILIPFFFTNEWNNIYVRYVNSLSVAEFPPHKLGLKTATLVNYSLFEQETCGEIKEERNNSGTFALLSPLDFDIKLLLYLKIWLFHVNHWEIWVFLKCFPSLHNNPVRAEVTHTTNK
jgi:hypothetical protein